VISLLDKAKIRKKKSEARAEILSGRKENASPR